MKDLFNETYIAGVLLIGLALFGMDYVYAERNLWLLALKMLLICFIGFMIGNVYRQRKMVRA